MTGSMKWVRYALIGTTLLMIGAVIVSRWWGSTPTVVQDDGWRPLPKLEAPPPEAPASK
jgi:hypothetical protein